MPVNTGEANGASPVVMFWNTSAVVPSTIGALVVSCQILSAWVLPSSTVTVRFGVTSTLASASPARFQAPLAAR